MTIIISCRTVLHLHHRRQMLVRQRVGLSNPIRGVLLDFEITLPQGVKVITERILELL
jgi:hypothetical protein